jgi:hypothetical protein
MKTLFSIALFSVTASLALACGSSAPPPDTGGVKAGPSPTAQATTSAGDAATALSTTPATQPTPSTSSTPSAAAAATAPAAGLSEKLPFHFEVKESAKPMPIGIQSFSHGEADKKWLFVGGRINGFHLTSTGESTFPTKTANDQLIVYNPSTQSLSKLPLPEGKKALLRASNAQHVQDGDVLYIAGGYGCKDESNNDPCYVTFPSLTAIKVREVIAAVEAQKPDKLASAILTINDDRLAVTGGVMRKVGDYFYLVFGQNYKGKYKGARNGAYTEQVRRFKIRLDGDKLSITDYKAFGDPTKKTLLDSEYHRRDLNVTPTVLPSGTLGLTAWGGVFSKGDLGWVHPISIEPSGAEDPKVTVVEQLEQKTNQYECAELAMFDPKTKSMYSTFFGGITLYFYKNGELTNSANEPRTFPFSNIISTVGRSGGDIREYIQPPTQKLPALIGANAKLVLAPGVAKYSGSEEIVDYSMITGDRVLLGHIVGGILSNAAQVAGVDRSVASDKLYDVYLVRP